MAVGSQINTRIGLRVGDLMYADDLALISAMLLWLDWLDVTLIGFSLCC